MIQIIVNEWKGWWRTGQLRWLILFFMLLLSVVGYFGVQDVMNRQRLISESKAEVRDQWENMGPSNPHSAAHYGSYAFKPISPLTALDEGVNLTAGQVLRLEGHVQNEVVHSSQSQSMFISYFGPLKASLILQVILPLFIIFLTYHSIQSEKQQGRIRLLMVQGISNTKLIFGKVLAVCLLALAILLITLVVQWATFSNLPGGDLLLRSGLVMLAYLSFYWIVSALTAAVSARSKGASSLTVMLSVWVVWLVFLPKLTGWFVEEQNPLPSRQEFTAAMREDRSKGLDGHNPTDEREKTLKDSVLLAYGVTSLDSLPINYDGIRMQADEEYGNIVWDKHFGDLFDVMQQQKASVQFAGILNPFTSLQSLSMGICGTDQWSHLHFQREAESYRRVFIKALNDEHAYGGSKNGDWGWKAEQAFFNDIEDFDYEIPSYKVSAGSYARDWGFLGFWVLLGFAFIRYSTRNTEQTAI